MLVKQYLQGVARLGPLVALEKDRWERRTEFGVAVKVAQEEERRRLERLRDIRRCVLAMVAGATEDEREGFVFERWERAPIGGFDLPLDAIVRTEGFDALRRGLAVI